MTFAEHAVAQVLRELVAEVEAEGLFTAPIGHIILDPQNAELVLMTKHDFIRYLRSAAQRLSPKPPGEK